MVAQTSKRITILGCGSSDGVPQIGCECEVCLSNDSRNKRTRASILIQMNDFNILIDAGPDLKIQALRENIGKIDAVFFTHAHFDHIGGAGDLKLLAQGPIPMFADCETGSVVYNNFQYAFRDGNPLYPPILKSNIFSGSFSIIKPQITIHPFRQKHGKHFSYGFRIGNFAYSTDVNELNDDAYSILNGVHTWIVDSIRYYGSPTHFCLDDTLKSILKVNPTQAIITHMCHDIDYNLLSSVLTSNIKVAYDGMKLLLQ